MRDRARGPARRPSVVIRDGAAEIRSAAERGARLSLHLIESVRDGPCRGERIDLNETVLEALTLVEHTAGDHVSVIGEPGTDLPQVAIGAEGIERILLNLVSNARDAIGGRGTVAVRTCRVPIPPGDSALGTG